MEVVAATHSAATWEPRRKALPRAEELGPAP